MCNPAKAKHAEGRTVKYSCPQFTSTLEEIITDEKLLSAFERAAKGKKSRAGVFRFTNDLGMNLERLKEEVFSHTYRPIPCRCFEIWCRAGQKKRIIAAPAFRDTVIQHLLYDETYNTFDRGFIFDSYGCRRGKGTHRASNRVQEFIRQSPVGSYYLQIDIRKYYYSIEHAILRKSLERKIEDKRIVDLMMLYCDSETGIGLNVGCLLSQLYGMIYLDRFDHWVKRVLKVKRYVRYVDDCVFIGETKEDCYRLLERIKEFLRVHLHLELSKWKINSLGKGVNFAGYWAWRDRRFIRKKTLYNMTKKIKQKKYDSIAAILAHSKRTSSYSKLLHKVDEGLSLEEQKNLHKKLREELREIHPKMPDPNYPWISVCKELDRKPKRAKPTLEKVLAFYST